MPKAEAARRLGIRRTTLYKIPRGKRRINTFS
ncbi:helix-turn-helix domain-containing protein [Corynebacterium jeddahense]|nr:helix-turn-helix domain-containing protein [Corynebacterium jeddahense]